MLSTDAKANERNKSGNMSFVVLIFLVISYDIYSHLFHGIVFGDAVSTAAADIQIRVLPRVQRRTC